MRHFLAVAALLFCALTIRAQFVATVFNKGASGSNIAPVLISSYQSGIANTGNGGSSGITNPSLVVYVRDPAGFVGGTNNCAVLWVHASTTYTIATPTDDKSETWTAGPTVTDAGSGIAMKSYYVLGTTAGTSKITVTTTGSSTTVLDYLGANLQEWQNCTVSGIGGTGTLDTAATGSPINITLGAAPTSGDAVIATYVDTAFSGAQDTCDGDTITVGAGFTAIAKSTCYGKASQYNISTTSTTVPITYSGTNKIIGIALTLKQGPAGTNPPSTKRIDHFQAEQVPTGSTSATLQFPSSGDLVVGLLNAGTNATVTAVSTANAGSPTFGTSCDHQNGISSAQAQVFHLYGAALTSTTTLTLTLNVGAAGNQIDLISVSNAVNGSGAFDKCGSGTGTVNQTSAANLTTDTITPTANGELIFTTASIDFHTLTGMVTDANSHVTLFLSAVDTSADDAQNTCTFYTNPSTLEQDNGYAVYANTGDHTQITFIYAGTQVNSGANCKTKPTGTLQDAYATAAFN